MSALVASLVAVAVAGGGPPAGGAPATVTTDEELSAAWLDPTVTEITLGGDIDLGCSDRNRPSGAALVLVGAGHTLTDTCPTSWYTFTTVSPVTLSGVRMVGRLGDPVTNVIIRARGLRIEGSELVSRSEYGTAVETETGSVIVDSTIRADRGIAVTSSADLLVEGSTLTGREAGLDVFTAVGPVVVRDSSVSAREVGIRNIGLGRIERSAVRGAVAVQALGPAVVADSTLVATTPAPGFGPGGALRAGGSRARVEVTRSTLSSEGADPAESMFLIEPVAGGTIAVQGSVLAAAAGAFACREDAGGVTSGGGNVASEGTCGLAGPGDVIADARLGPIDPAVGFAVPPAGSPARDHVSSATCDGATDQRGVARPQGSACDAGAIELEQDEGPPPTTDPGSPDIDDPTLPGPAQPATPIVGPARFTG